ncbi:type IV pilus twitching motility protein PilT [Paenibacillus roseipurpureus]|uniref:Type IV pilus twitching motility protein PilT n=1 Tax=Paenibacillus roseopurpureus TaxID=2918901 RepID=A0AA96RGN4_9BACL|nr:type IV pilus twitching motility protein PilT [Paenibacillus sp. MBLB1832]WNR42378.1 type IV pilus twitching motility protein PilT [Paenibacillus sp. MBLB1832]
MSMMAPTSSNTLSLKDLLRISYESKASDLHINAGTEPLMRLHGKLMKVVDAVLHPEDTLRMAREILTNEQYETLSSKGEVDFSFELPGLSRYRGNVFKQKRSINMVFRVLSTTVPSLFSLHLPDLVQEFAFKHQGLVLVTGPTGSGKSTTLASIIDFINETQKKHIITLEDPIEYIHPSKNCLVAQREIGIDTHSFSNGLRAALRQDPDVILVGEMRDLETIKTAITAAETGHLVLATLHTPDAPQTVDRIIDVFPTEQQRQIRVQLASVLISVLSQRLVPRMDGRGRAMALEILINTPAVANLIRQEKIYQIKSVIQTNRQIGMQTMVSSLKQLVEEGIIHRDAIKEYEMSIGDD